MGIVVLILLTTTAYTLKKQTDAYQTFTENEAKPAPVINPAEFETEFNSLVSRLRHFEHEVKNDRRAEIALSPGVRWGPSILPGGDITREDLWNVTSMSYGEAYRTEMTGEYLHVVLEDVADNLFNPDPYYQQGGDMVRTGGLGYRIDITKPQGSRITEMTLLKTGEAIDPSKTYQVAGWASVNEGTEGPPIWDVVEAHIAKQGTISLDPNNSVKVVGT
jgi:sulfur-oxidizing protein SoxB